MRYVLLLLATAGIIAICHKPAPAWETPSVQSSPYGYSPRKVSAAKKKPTRVQGYVKREEPAIEVQNCVGPVKVVGSQWADASGAEDSAKKAWMEAVRWEHGEAYLDIQRARNYRHRCSRSSIGEVIGQVMHRCEISAEPCRPILSKDK